MLFDTRQTDIHYILLTKNYECTHADLTQENLKDDETQNAKLYILATY